MKISLLSLAPFSLLPFPILCLPNNLLSPLLKNIYIYPRLRAPAGSRQKSGLLRLSNLTGGWYRAWGGKPGLGRGEGKDMTGGRVRKTWGQAGDGSQALTLVLATLSFRGKGERVSKLVERQACKINWEEGRCERPFSREK